METVKLFFKEAWVLISSISWRDFIDIALVTIILFYAFRFIRDRRAGKLIVGVVLLVVFFVLMGRANGGPSAMAQFTRANAISAFPARKRSRLRT